MDRFFYGLARGLVKVYLLIFRGMRVYGSENVPTKGPLIIAGNHISNMDPPALAAAIDRRCTFMAKKELFANAAFAWLLRSLGAFPVDRGRADIEAIKTSLKNLKDGRVLMVFPEGTRHKPGQLGQAQPGIVSIALKAKVPILPCALTNTEDGKRPIVIRIGKPISLEQYFDRKLTKEETEELGANLMGEIARLLEKDRSMIK